MLLKIVWKNIIHKKLNSFLAILLMAFGIGIISLLINIGKQLQDKFAKNISGVDMVVGAKGSPLQIILSGIYQIDAPTGNIPLEELNVLKQNPLVKKVIPLSMGDNYQGFRIVGSEKSYLEHFNAQFKEGKEFTQPMEVVVGATAAQKLNLRLNDSFASSHGFDKEGEDHHEEKFRVVGILSPNNSILDNIIISNLASVWQMHEGHQNESTKKEVTCALVKFRSPLGLVAIPRTINQNTSMQAALPSIEINRLFELMGIGINALQALALAIMLISGVSVFITLYNALKERKYELALMLSLGGKRGKLFFILLLEGIILALAGYILGIIFSRVGQWIASLALNKGYNYSFQQQFLQKEELYLLIVALLIGVVAAAIPSIGIYKLNISKTLAND